MSLYDDVVLAVTAAGGYKEGKIYSVKPDGLGDYPYFTVVRATTPNRINKDGDTDVVPINTPVIDWTTGSPLLIVSEVGEITLTTPSNATKVVITINGVDTEYNNVFPTLVLPVGSISKIIATDGGVVYDLLRDHLLRVSADSGTITDEGATEVKDFLSDIEDNELEPSLAFTAGGGFKTGKAYSVIPSNGSGDFDVARNSATATRVRPDGFIEPVAANVPRIDYSSGEAALLVEAPATNLLPFYKSFARSAWAKTGARIEGDPSTAGSENFTGFTTLGTGWSQPTPLVYQSNTVSGNNAVSQTVFASSQLGKLFRFSFRIVNSTSGTLYLRATGFNNVLHTLATASTSAGVYTLYLVAQSTSQILELVTESDTGWVGIIDQISLKEVTGFTCPVLNADGSNSMAGYKLVENTSNGQHVVFSSSITTTSGLSYIHSLYVKEGERFWVYLEDVTTGLGAFFNLSNNTMGTVNAGVTASIVDSVLGWKKISITLQSLATARLSIRTSTGNNIKSYQGDGTSGIFISHANLVQASAPSSLILGTEGSTVNRIADVVSKTNAAGLFGDTEGVIYLKIRYNQLTSTAAAWIIEYLGGVSGKYFRLSMHIGSRVRLNANSTSIIFTAGATTNTNFTKIAIAYNPSGVNVFINGVKYTHSAEVVNGLNTIYKAAISQCPKIELQEEKYFSTLLSDAKLIELTTL